MEIKLKAVVSTVIKTKLPLTRLVWLGQDSNNLFSLDLKKVKKICLSSGNTKQKIKQIQHLLPDVVSLSASPIGNVLCGLLSTGEIFLWHRFQDKVQMINKFPDDLFLKSKNTGHLCTSLFISSDASKLVVIHEVSKIYLWQRHSFPNDERTESIGCWSFVNKDDRVKLPTVECLETTIQVAFINDPFLGNICLCSFVFSFLNNICMSTVIITSPLHLNPTNSPKCACQNASWKMLSIPMETLCPTYTPLKEVGALVTRYSNNGKMLSVAVNQYYPRVCQLLFLSSYSDAFHLVELKGILPPPSSPSKLNWIADMAWTADDTYVLCAACNGSVCVVSRLGSLVMLISYGCSLNLGPSYYLSVHQTMSNASSQTFSGQREHADVYKYTVSTHPILPLVLACDGYHVACFEFPSVTEMTDAVSAFLNASHEMIHPNFLYHNHISPKSYTQKPSFDIVLQQSSTTSQHNSSLKGLQDSTEELNGKKREVGNLQQVQVKEQQLIDGIKALLAVWGLTASSDYPITKELSILCEFAVNTFQKAVWLLLYSNVDIPTIASITGISLHPEQATIHEKSYLAALFSIRLLSKCLSIFGFDTLYFNLLPYILKLSNSLIKLVLNFCPPDDSYLHLKIVQALFSVLNNVQEVISNACSLQSYLLSSDTVIHNKCAFYRNCYRPCGLFPAEKMNQEDFVQVEDKDINRLYCKRKNITFSSAKKQLFQSWLLLYNNAAHLYSSVSLDDFHEEVTFLLCQLQQILQEGNQWPCTNRRYKPNKGVVLSICGKPKKALIWLFRHLPDVNVDQIEEDTDCIFSSHSHFLHTILYLCFHEGLLCLAVKFIYGLINQDVILPDAECNESELNQSLSHKKCSALKSVNTRWLAEKLCGLENKAVRKVAKSFARFFAAYFINRPIYIYPAHIAKSLPSLLIPQKQIGRRIGILASNITTQLVREGLENIVTPNAVLELLLLLGLWREASWFAHQLGNWKISFLLTIAEAKGCPQHPVSGQSKTSLELHPQDIIMPRLSNYLMYTNSKSEEGTGTPLPTSMEGVYEADAHHLSSLQNLLLAAVLSGLDVVPTMLQEMTKHLKMLISDMPLLVSKDVYLPSPHPYCPQSPSNNMDISVQPNNESLERYTMASVVQSMLTVLKASNLAIPLVKLYLTFLHNTWEILGLRMEPIKKLCNLFGVNVSDWMDGQQEVLRGSQSLQYCLLYFRDLCAVLWMAYVRDHLSLACRKLQDCIVFGFSTRNEPAANFPVLTEALEWAVHLHHFQNVHCKEVLLQMILNFVVELPLSEKIVELLAKVFNQSDNLSSGIQKQLSDLCTIWKGCKVNFNEERISETNEVSVKQDLHDRGEDIKCTAEIPPGDRKQDAKLPLNTLKSNVRSEDNNEGFPFENAEELQSFNILFMEKCRKEKEILQLHETSPFKINFFLFSDNINADNISKQHIVHTFELEESFINFLEIFLHVSIMKHFDNLKISNDKIPLLKSHQEKLKGKAFSSLSNSFSDLSRGSTAYSFPSPLLMGGYKDIPLSKSSRFFGSSGSARTKNCHNYQSRVHPTSSSFNLSKTSLQVPLDCSVTKFTGKNKSKSEEDISQYRLRQKSRHYISDLALNLSTHPEEYSSIQDRKENVSTSLNASKHLLNNPVRLNTESLICLLSEEYKWQIPLLVWLFHWIEKQNTTCNFTPSSSELFIQVNIRLKQLLFTYLLQKHFFKLKTFLHKEASKEIDENLKDTAEHLQKTDQRKKEDNVGLPQHEPTVKDKKGKLKEMYSDGQSKTKMLHPLLVQKNKKSARRVKINKEHLKPLNEISLSHGIEIQTEMPGQVLQKNSKRLDNECRNIEPAEPSLLLPKNPSFLAMTATSAVDLSTKEEGDTTTMDGNSQFVPRDNFNHLMAFDDLTLPECQSWFVATKKTLSSDTLNVSDNCMRVSAGMSAPTCIDDIDIRHTPAITQEFSTRTTVVLINKEGRQKRILKKEKCESQEYGGYDDCVVSGNFRRHRKSAQSCENSCANSYHLIPDVIQNQQLVQRQEMELVTRARSSIQNSSMLSGNSQQLMPIASKSAKENNHKEKKTSSAAIDLIPDKEEVTIPLNESHRVALQDPVKNCINDVGVQTVNSCRNVLKEFQQKSGKTGTSSITNNNSSALGFMRSYKDFSANALQMEYTNRGHGKRRMELDVDEKLPSFEGSQNGIKIGDTSLRDVDGALNVSKKQTNFHTSQGLPLVCVDSKFPERRTVTSSKINTFDTIFINPLKTFDLTNQYLNEDEASSPSPIMEGSRIYRANVKLYSQPAEHLPSHQEQDSVPKQQLSGMDNTCDCSQLPSSLPFSFKLPCVESKPRGLPLLSLQEKPYKPSLLTLKHKTVASTLIPPETIIAYKKKKRQKEIIKVYDSVKASQPLDVLRGSEMKLFKIPPPPCIEPKDGRNNPKRQKRRQQLQPKTEQEDTTSKDQK